MIHRAFLACLLATTAVAAPLQIRVAAYNASLNRNALGQLATDLSTPNNPQAKRVAEIIQRVAPDIILVNEFDYEAGNAAGPTSALELFHTNYLQVSQNGQAALTFPHRYIAPSNTGVPTGVPGGNSAASLNAGDFDNSGAVVTTPGSDLYGNDCFGFGQFPGQYSFAVYSKYPILAGQLRSFRNFLWKDMPSPNFPDNTDTPAPLDYYTVAEKAIFRISSKNHVDLPIELLPGHVLHLLCSHPTPPAFDGNEDRNGRRNFDEIRLWADYISNKNYVKDDAGVFGGLDDDQRFIILGDLNADPLDGDSFTSGGVRAINQLRNHPRVNSAFNPSSPGGTQNADAGHGGNPAFDTADFGNPPGNLRVDHVLPSKVGLNPVAGGVFWPLNSDPTFPLVNASDHRLVWTDFAVVPVVRQAVRALTPGAAGNDAIITWRTQQGVTYKVQRSGDLAAWSDVPGIPIVFDADVATATDAGGRLSLPKFYRVVTSLEAPPPVPALRVKRRR